MDQVVQMRPLRGRPRTKRLYGFDVETADKNKKFVCASLYGDDIEHTFWTRDELVTELLERKYRGAFICATNLMFDFFAVFGIEFAVSHFDLIERNGRLLLASCYVENGRFCKKADTSKRSEHTHKLTFIDTLNHLAAGVKALGQIVNIPKHVPPPFLGNCPANSTERAQLQAYNMNDARISCEFMRFLQHIYNMLGSELKCTVSSSALDNFRRTAQQGRWTQEPREQISMCYNAYYGGRTEAFCRGMYEHINAYDVNSLYPYILQKHTFPMAGSARESIHITTDDIDTFEGVAYASFHVPYDIRPIMPTRTDKLRFGYGHVQGWYDFCTMRAAMDAGAELTMPAHGLIYEQSHKPFRTFIRKLYAKRQELKARNDPSQLVAKLLMNGFYGKLGYQYKNKERLVDDAELHELIGNDQLSIYPTHDPHIWRTATNANARIPKHVFPIYPVYVSAYARLHMHTLYKRVGDVLYTDTDCVFTHRRLETSTDLGGLKLENEFEQIVIVKPKFYAGRTTKGADIVKLKGVHGALSGYEAFISMLTKPELDMMMFRKLRSAIGHDERYVNEQFTLHKHISLEDDKRVWPAMFGLEPQSSEPIRFTNP